MSKTCYCYLLCIIIPGFLFGSSESLDSLINKGNRLYRYSPDTARLIIEEVLERSTDNTTLGEAYYLEGRIFSSVDFDFSNALSSFYSALDNFLIGMTNFFS